MSKTLLIVTDPLCGWCYAAAPLIKLARDVYQIKLYQGGLLTHSRRVYMSESMRDYVLGHDMRIQQLTGQPFAPAYTDGILKDHSFFMDSTIPIAAINASIALGSDGVQMLDAIQIGYYIHGKSTSEVDNMRAYALAIGHDADAFSSAYQQAFVDVELHINAAREILTSLGSSSFPTFAIKIGDDFMRIDHAHFYDKPAQWLDYLASFSA